HFSRVFMKFEIVGTVAECQMTSKTAETFNWLDEIIIFFSNRERERERERETSFEYGLPACHFPVGSLNQDTPGTNRDHSTGREPFHSQKDGRLDTHGFQSVRTFSLSPTTV